VTGSKLNQVDKRQYVTPAKDQIENVRKGEVREEQPHDERSTTDL
jgi:hypothetical protein